MRNENYHSLEPKDKRWLEQKSKETQKPIIALVRQAIRRLRSENEAKSPSFDTLLEQTGEMWNFRVNKQSNKIS